MLRPEKETRKLEIKYISIAKGKEAAGVTFLSSQYRRSIEFNRPKGATILILIASGMGWKGVERGTFLSSVWIVFQREYKQRRKKKVVPFLPNLPTL